jgi:dnd system-associated protein 4
MARIRVETEYHEFYRILANDEGEARVKTFDTMKDVFMLAFAFGVVKRHRTALGPSREVFDDRVLRDTDKDLIKAVVLADDEGALHSLADEDALLQVAQEYANTGIRVLRQEYLSATPAESMASALLDLVPH